MLTKHDERKMPKNLGHIESLARSYTDTAIKTLAGIMMEQTSPPMARIVAAKVLLDRGWGKPKEMPHSEVDDNKTLLKVVNEIVHVYETREQIEFRDQTPLLELTPEDTDGNGSKVRIESDDVLIIRTAPIFQPLLAPARYKDSAQRLAMYPR